MSTMPRLKSPDSTLSVLLEGYEFLLRRRRRFHCDAFRGRLMLEPAIFMGGSEASELFYSERFQRAGAMPKPVLKTLFGEGGVHGLDGRAHHVRKAMFLRLMTQENILRLLEVLDQEWESALERWSAAPRVVLFDEVNLVLCRAACRWAGVEVTEDEARRLAADFARMVHDFAAVGPGWQAARRARRRTEAWGQDVIERVRAGTLTPSEDTASHVFAHAQDADGSVLPSEVASVELLNIVRPTVAIGRYIAWCALALRDYPAYAERLKTDDDAVDAFVQEVRRFYPFVPFLGARVRTGFEWRGVSFEPGTLTILDVYGTNHDPRLWKRPEQFEPERFIDREPGAHTFIPHGGGDFATGHRCAGEWLTIEVMKRAVGYLTRCMSYELPAQDLGYSLSRILALPRSGVVLSSIRRNNPLQAGRTSQPPRGLEVAHAAE